MSSARGAIAIVGVGESAYTWSSGVSETELAVTAVAAAMADAGLSAADLDGLACFSFDSAKPTVVAQRLGMPELRLALETPTGPASAVSMLAAAAAAVASDQARAVACYRAFNGRSMLRLGHLPLPPQTPDGHVLAAGELPLGGEFTGPYGVVSPACAFPLWVNAYAARYGISAAKLEAALCRIVVGQRACAVRNPRALLRDRPLDADGYRASPIVAEPLRKVDFCLESDGACAFVVAGSDRGRRASPVWVLGTAQSLLLDYDNFFFDADELPPRPDRTLLPRLLAMHGVAPADIDVAGLYDACSANVLFDLENLGLCSEGEAVDCVHVGRPAVNTSGGMLAEVYLQGMNQLIEVVRQLRGDSANQVPGARLGVASVAAAQGVALLSGERPA